MVLVLSCRFLFVTLITCLLKLNIKRTHDVENYLTCALYVPIFPICGVSMFLGFFRRCVVNVQDGLAKVLNYVTTVKGLTTIRDELWNLLKNVSFSFVLEAFKHRFPLLKF